MGSVILTKIIKDPELGGCPSHSSASLDIVSSYFTIRANLSVTLCNATNYWVRSGVCFDQAAWLWFVLLLGDIGSYLNICVCKSE